MLRAERPWCGRRPLRLRSMMRTSVALVTNVASPRRIIWLPIMDKTLAIKPCTAVTGSAIAVFQAAVLAAPERTAALALAGGFVCS